MLMQAIASLYCLIFGAAASLAYDIMRFVRALLRISYPICRYSRFHKLIEESAPRENVARLILISSFDLLYFAVLTAVGAVFLFHVNYGSLRWYFIAAFAVGFAVYRVLFSRLAMPYLVLTSILVRRAFTKFMRLFTFPARCFAKHALLPIAEKLRANRRKKYTKKVINALPRMLGANR